MKINITSIEAARHYEQTLHFIRRAGKAQRFANTRTT